MRAPLSHVNKLIRFTKEQDRRGLDFALEVIEGKGDEGDKIIKTLIHQKGFLERE